MKRNKLFGILSFTAVLSALLIIISISSFAAEPLFINPETGYSVYIDDKASLLDKTETEELGTLMEDITSYGNVLFCSAYNVDPESVYKSYFGTESGTVLVIDMGERRITIYSYGNIYKTITKKYATIITDNVYEFVSDGDYFTCAYTAFSQISQLLDGGRISQPMRHITNALAAIVFALIGNFIYLWFGKKRITVSAQRIASIAGASAATVPFTKKLISMHRSSVSSSSDNDGGGYSGGGGDSGGGGSHSF